MMLSVKYTVRKTALLGAGGYGNVYKGMDRRTNDTVAIKQCVASKSTGTAALEEFKNLQYVAESKHPNIILVLDVFYEDNNFWLVTEFCDQGNLDSYMCQYCPPIDILLKLMYQCANAVAFLHGLKPLLVHRDIKPSNFLIKTERGCHIVKIADFGISRTTNPDVILKTKTGTEIFLAPDVYANQPYNEKVDVFSLGLVFVALLEFRLVDDAVLGVSLSRKGDKFQGYGKILFEASVKRQLPPSLVKVSRWDSVKVKLIKHLVINMLLYNSEERCTAEETRNQLKSILRDHVTLTDEDWSIKDPGQVDDPDQFEHLLGLLSDHTPSDDSTVTLQNTDVPVDKQKSATVIVGQMVQVQDARDHIYKVGTVTYSDDSLVDVFYSDGSSYYYPTEAVTVVATDTIHMTDTGHMIKWLDLVVVHQKSDLEKFQTGFGGVWPTMTQDINLTAVVRKVQGQRVTVEFTNKHRAVVNLLCLTQVNSSGLQPSPQDYVLIHNVLADSILQLGEAQRKIFAKCFGQIGQVVELIDEDLIRVKIAEKMYNMNKSLLRTMKQK